MPGKGKGANFEAKTADQVYGIGDKFIEGFGDTPKRSTPGEDPSIDETSESKEAEKSRKQLIGAAAFNAMEKRMDDNVNIVATSISEADRTNALNEAISRKTASNILTKIPFAGQVFKAVYAETLKRTANKKIDQTGNLDSAYEALGLKREDSRIINSNEDSTARVKQAIARGDKQVSYLNQEERVEQLKNPEIVGGINNIINDYYKERKKLYGSENASESIKKLKEECFAKAQEIGRTNGISIDLNPQLNSVDNIVNDYNIREKDFKDYLEKNTSFFRADIQRGINTKVKVDPIIDTVVTKGVAAGVLLAVGTREGRGLMRKAVGVLGAGSGIAGAVVGGIYGYYRGRSKGRAELSDVEINESTFDNNKESTKAPSKAMAVVGSIVKKFGNAITKTELGNKYYNWSKGQDLLSDIKELRDRKDASEYINMINEGLGQIREGKDTETAKKKLEETLADIIARSDVSKEKNIDLIRYKDNERNDIEGLIEQVGLDLYGEESSEQLRSHFTDDNEYFAELKKELIEKADKASELEKEYINRRAIVNAISGAIIGGTAGTLTYLALENETVQNFASGIKESVVGTIHPGSDPESMEFTGNEDSGYALKLGDKEILTASDDTEIFENDGSLTSEAQETLKEAGIEFEAQTEPIEYARTNISLNEFFSPENKEANGLVEIHRSGWASESEQVILGNTHMGDNGDIIMQVAPVQGSDTSLEDMQVVLTAGGDDEIGLTFDVDPETGTIEIPSDSPAASLFNGNEYLGDYAEVVKPDGNGGFEVFTTNGDGISETDIVSVQNPDAEYISGYKFTIDGQEYEVDTPEEVSKMALMEARTGYASSKGLGEPSEFIQTGESTNLETTSGESIEVKQFEHHGGYSDINDSYYGEKDNNLNSGASIVRRMLENKKEDGGLGLSHTEANNLSSEEADQLFLESINNGQIKEGDVIEEWLKAVGDSPEALVTTRAMMGDYHFDIDGDGVEELIDSQNEINAVADIISRMSPEDYDAQVNDIYDHIYEKLSNAHLRFINQAQEQYQYTTWATRNQDGNIIQNVGAVNRSTNGVGMTFVDSDGNSFFDLETARSIWGLPNNYQLNYVAVRLDCLQETSNGKYIDEAIGQHYLHTSHRTTPSDDNPTPEPEPTPPVNPPQPKNQIEANENSGANQGIVTPEGQERQITPEPSADEAHPYNQGTNTYDYTPKEQAEKIGYEVNKTDNATVGTGEVNGNTPSADGSGDTIEKNLNEATGVEGANNQGF